MRPCSLDHYSTHERISDSAFGIGCQRAGAQYVAHHISKTAVDQSALKGCHPNLEDRASFTLRAKDGGGERDRTDGLLVANQALSQLSYTPARQPTSPAARVSVDLARPECVVGLGRLELPTSRLSGVRSNHLSYRPMGADRSKLNREGGANRILHTPQRRSMRHVLHRKEVIQPQVPLRLPCYDFTPITDHTLDACLPYGLARQLLVQPAFVV